MDQRQAELNAAKQRLNAAAARLLAGDRTAAEEADIAMAETNRILSQRREKAEHD